MKRQWLASASPIAIRDFTVAPEPVEAGDGVYEVSGKSADGKPLRRVESNPQPGEYAFDARTGVVSISAASDVVSIGYKFRPQPKKRRRRSYCN